MNHCNTHIISQAREIELIVKNLRQEKKKIVLTQGSFDLVHIGHARYCDRARDYGDALIVGVFLPILSFHSSLFLFISAHSSLVNL